MKSMERLCQTQDGQQEWKTVDPEVQRVPDLVNVTCSVNVNCSACDEMPGLFTLRII